MGSGDHNVYALDTKTGALRWKFATGNVVHASPAVADGLVYVGIYGWTVSPLREYYIIDDWGSIFFPIHDRNIQAPVEPPRLEWPCHRRATP